MREFMYWMIIIIWIPGTFFYVPKIRGAQNKPIRFLSNIGAWHWGNIARPKSGCISKFEGYWAFC